ncbi:hypothetical protein HDU82_003475 [Entophlyctis luteolus]|nr:hypothetical protein HDU82_003475 [Entophlyctis luteolus]
MAVGSACIPGYRSFNGQDWEVSVDPGVLDFSSEETSIGDVMYADLDVMLADIPTGPNTQGVKQESKKDPVWRRLWKHIRMPFNILMVLSIATFAVLACVIEFQSDICPYPYSAAQKTLVVWPAICYLADIVNLYLESDRCNLSRKWRTTTVVITVHITYYATFLSVPTVIVLLGESEDFRVTIPTTVARVVVLIATTVMFASVFAWLLTIICLMYAGIKLFPLEKFANASAGVYAMFIIPQFSTFNSVYGSITGKSKLGKHSLSVATSIAITKSVLYMTILCWANTYWSSVGVIGIVIILRKGSVFLTNLLNTLASRS